MPENNSRRLVSSLFVPELFEDPPRDTDVSEGETCFFFSVPADQASAAENKDVTRDILLLQIEAIEQKLLGFLQTFLGL